MVTIEWESKIAIETLNLFHLRLRTSGKREREKERERERERERKSGNWKRRRTRGFKAGPSGVGSACQPHLKHHRNTCRSKLGQRYPTATTRYPTGHNNSRPAAPTAAAAVPLPATSWRCNIHPSPSSSSCSTPSTSSSSSQLLSCHQRCNYSDSYNKKEIEAKRNIALSVSHPQRHPPF